MTEQTPRTLVELLRRHAERYGDKVAFTFSNNGDDDGVSRLTYAELDLRARAIAATLQQQGAAGERVLVFCRPGLDGIAGYFGCVYAGAVAVPVHERLAPRLSSVIPDAQARFALASPETPAEITTAVDTLVGWIEGIPVRWCGTDVAVGHAQAWVAPDIDPDSTAMMQYTSGSTTSPKGVLLTHRNLLHNLEAMRQAWGADDSAIGVYWVPQHHDMGMIGGILEMLYAGATTHLMSPGAFIERPMRWLEAIARHRATITAGPNMGYDQCIERSTPEERAALDLSSWSVALIGSDPVRAATLRAFAEAFGPAGFVPEAFWPAYGLAEATLLVTSGRDSVEQTVARLDRDALAEDRVLDAASEDPAAAEVVGCGRILGGQQVVIVDSETRRRCGADEVGEILVAGPSVGQGYWDRPAETRQAFGAVLADTGEGPFLRTGDLGFLRAGELFITGRVKDLVVIEGRNYYPNDIEATVQASHPMLLSGRGAVFVATLEAGALEQLVVAQEVGGPVGDDELREIVDAIQAAVSQHQGIPVGSVVLVPAIRIPTTSSGKIQRGLCRQRFLDRKLQTVAEWHAPVRPAPTGDPEGARLIELFNAAEARRAAAQGGVGSTH